MIESVEELSPEYHRLPLRDVSGLHQGDIEVELARAKNNASTAVTEHRWKRSTRKRRHGVRCCGFSAKGAGIEIAGAAAFPTKPRFDTTRGGNRTIAGTRTHLRTGLVKRSDVVHGTSVLIGNRHRRTVLH